MIARIRARIDFDADGGCWEWDKPHPSGYGRVYWNGHHYLAHRAVYEAEVGPIPVGLTLDHLCENRRCVNPEHLEPVPHRVNLLRSARTLAGQNVRRDACRSGHPYAEHGYVNGRGHRVCRTCARERWLRHTAHSPES